MTSPPPADALTRLERLLFAAPVVEGFIARREAGLIESGDAETATALVVELMSHQGSNGSWGDSLAATAEALLLMADLEPFETNSDDSISRALTWLRGRQRAPGSFADLCTDEAHAIAVCPHFTTGFYSPGPRTRSFAFTTLSNGTVFPSDDDARLAMSALALRAILIYRQPAIDDLLHLDALLRLTTAIFRGETVVSMPATVAILMTMTQAPRSLGHLTTLHGALSRLAGLQRADGTWPGTDMFHVAEALLLAQRAGYGSPLFDAALQRTARMLALTQQADGSWGNDAGGYRLLTGWRLLRYVTAKGK